MVRSNNVYNAVIISSVALRISDLSNPLRISPSISVSRNSIIRQRSPSRRLSRCRRMRSAADDRTGVPRAGSVVLLLKHSVVIGSDDINQPRDLVSNLTGNGKSPPTNIYRDTLVEM